MLKDRLSSLRYAIGSTFSKVYSAKKRWLDERDEWEALGIAETEMRRKVYVVPRTGAVCITVSKCANTTLKFMLYPVSAGEAVDAHGDDRLLTRLIDTGRTLNDLRGGSARIFTFCRHPVSRFWSAYLTRIAGRRSQIAQEVAAHLRIPAGTGLSPETVLEYVRDASPVTMDEHIRPQWACTGIERLPIDFVGRVETMSDDIQRLCEMGFLDAGHVRRFRHLNRSSAREIPDKARIDRIVRDVYARDMELFGYD